MRLRWGRVLGAMAGLGLAVNVGPLLALWWTMPDAVTVQRALPPDAPLACATGEVLEAAGRAHPDHGEPDGGAADRAALAEVLRAGRCGELAALDTYSLFPAFVAVQHGLSALDPVARPAEAIDGALAVWELAADQQRAGSLVNAAVWMAIGRDAHGILDTALARADGVDEARLAEIQRRLTRVATTEVDRDVVRVEEERATWQWIHLAYDPRALVPAPWRLVLDARRGVGEMVTETTAMEDEVRTRAAVLAAAAEMSLDRRQGGGCGSESAVLDAIRGMELDVSPMPDRCAVLGAYTDGAVVAIAR